VWSVDWHPVGARLTQSAASDPTDLGQQRGCHQGGVLHDHVVALILVVNLQLIQDGLWFDIVGGWGLGHWGGVGIGLGFGVPGGVQGGATAR